MDKTNEKVYLTIVTPCYNAAGRMEYYFRSIREQSDKRFRLIMIDDCSADGTYDYLVKEAKVLEALGIGTQVLKNSNNLGAGQTRNIGMNYVNTDYFTFVDCDDVITLDFVNVLYNCLYESNGGKYINKNIDILIFDHFRITAKQGEYAQSAFFAKMKAGYISKQEAFVYVRGGVWGKVFSRSLFDKTVEEGHQICFPKLKVAEDQVLVREAIYSANSIFYLKNNLYYYTTSASSLVHTTELDEVDPDAAYSMIKDYINKLNPGDFSEELNAYFLVCIFSAGYLPYIFNKYDRKSGEKELKDILRKNHIVINNIYLKKYPIYMKMPVILIKHNLFPVLYSWVIGRKTIKKFLGL